MKTTNRFRVYATEACKAKHLMELNTNWYETEKEALEKHYNLCVKNSDQSLFDSYDKNDFIPKNFISDDYKLETETLYFCDCGEEIDEHDVECFNCEYDKRTKTRG